MAKKKDEPEVKVKKGKIAMEHAFGSDAKSFHLSLDATRVMEADDVADALDEYARDIRSGSIDLYSPDEESHH